MAELLNPILQALEDLQENTRVIGSGNLQFTIEEKNDNEIDNLSSAFNRMTTDLRAVTASKADLEQEMEERRRIDLLFYAAPEKIKNLLVLSSLSDDFIVTIC